MHLFCIVFFLFLALVSLINFTISNKWIINIISSYFKSVFLFISIKQNKQLMKKLLAQYVIGVFLTNRVRKYTEKIINFTSTWAIYMILLPDFFCSSTGFFFILTWQRWALHKYLRNSQIQRESGKRGRDREIRREKNTY